MKTRSVLATGNFACPYTISLVVYRWWILPNNHLMQTRTRHYRILCTHTRNSYPVSLSCDGHSHAHLLRRTKYHKATEYCCTCMSDVACPDKLSREVSAIAPSRKNAKVLLFCSADWVESRELKAMCSMRTKFKFKFRTAVALFFFFVFQLGAWREQSNRVLGTTEDGNRRAASYTAVHCCIPFESRFENQRLAAIQVVVARF